MSRRGLHREKGSRVARDVKRDHMSCLPRALVDRPLRIEIHGDIGAIDQAHLDAGRAAVPRLARRVSLLRMVACGECDQGPLEPALRSGRPSEHTRGPRRRQAQSPRGTARGAGRRRRDGAETEGVLNKVRQQLHPDRDQRRLERTAAPIDEIAWRVGYEGPTFFRRLFKRTTGITPGAYRRRFSIPDFARRGAAPGHRIPPPSLEPRERLAHPGRAPAAE